MNSVNKNETYLILERSNAPLKSLKENNEYILEGIFTSFDVLNENQRIYQWKEFEPHFKVLHEKIKNGKTVYGNADHPASPMSEPRLLDAAIILENLEYDKINNCVNGRVKVLDTNAGKQIKAIMDGGGQVSISSRALGSVRENKTVAIERLITYDLVAEPGFANANLTRVNESFGILNENIAIFKIPITENAIINDAVENKAEPIQSITPTSNTEKIDLEKYNKVMSFMNENNKNEIVEALLEKVYGYIENKISPQLQELTESVNKLQKIPEYINEYFGEGEEVREKLGLISDMNEYLNTVLPVQVSRLVNDNMESFKSDISRNNTTSNGELSLDPDYNRTVGGVRNNEIDVVSLKAETNEAKLNVVIEYLLNEMPKLKEVSDYAIHNGERLKELSEYVSLNGLHLNDNLENIGETLESLKENANRNIDLEQYITHELPKVNALFEYIQYMRGRVNNMGCYVNNELSPKVFQNLEDIFSKISEQLGVENYSKIMRKEETDITEQVDQILAIATKKKEAETTRETLNFYVRQLDETKQKQFSFLTESQRQKFINQINNVQPTNINELNMIWSKVVDKNSLTEDKQNFIIANMPKIIKPLYEQLALSEQQRLLEISNNYVLDTPYKVQNFWTNRTEFKGMLEKQVRESYNPGLKSDDYINSLDENKQNIVRKMRALNS